MNRLGLLGSSGRMGKLIDQITQKDFFNQAQVCMRVHRGDDLQTLLRPGAVDVVIDVSLPAVMKVIATHALQCQQELPAFVIGSTGWPEDGLSDLKKLAKKTPVLLSSNFSVGVYTLNKILKDHSTLLKKLGYMPVLVETHHCHKKDAPSGTALSLQKSLQPYSPQEIQTHCIRAGEVIGDHEITFYGSADQIKLAHSAQDRSIFARGAIEVALWLASLRKHSKVSGKLLEMTDYFEHLSLK
jgi:4-hydroxy-tetrahydrodipicolinate reductase